ncbi:hypothetical protein H310_03924 [Aphanomyces invadans]|uniref:Uncharacterized protein n=1 Tax=Aphanomyces invadans TaxID=157072 RepID=A0A024UEZ4_9STRA|nr:hypothetical protein H310_03924 [Aphanomyces invadans]ETW04785.1 hypothetical protein H310_03924 [Aphanomyces invadans]RHY30182.1 hypothetical protein DYB32_004576 [Aphanomyces invadans]|eukprot:XP_008866223.1 hypothetical protein H310_03924 [Aphanomyces invadans]
MGILQWIHKFLIQYAGPWALSLVYASPVPKPKRMGPWLVVAIVQFAIHTAASQDCAAPLTMSSKISPELQQAFSTQDHVNIMVEMTRSTSEVEAVPGDRTQYMQNLQAFSAAQHQPVKDLLALHPDEFIGEAQYFWIDSKVHVPQATAVLAMELASLPTVKAIRGEVTAHIMTTGGGLDL